MSGTREPRLSAELDALRRALIGRRQDSKVTVDTVRVELAEAGIDGNRLGGLFREAKRRGWIRDIGAEPSRHRSRKGGKVTVYRRNAIDPRGRGKRKPRRPAEPLFLGDTFEEES